MSISPRALSLVVPLALLGCATSYENAHASSRQEGPGKLIKIGFSANGYTENAKAMQYALFRAAEAAQESGKPFFIIYKTMRDAAADRAADEPNLGIVGNRPEAFAFVMLLDQKRPHAKDTAELLKQRDQALASTTTKDWEEAK